MSASYVPSEKVLKYERFLNDALKEDLRKVLENRDKVYAEIAEYLQLKNTIERIQEASLTDKQLKTKVDLGCNFYVNAKIPDTSRIFVKVGFGFFVELTLDEAVCFIDKKVKFLESITATLTNESSKLKTKIKLVLEGLRELQLIDPVISEDVPQKDL